MMHKDISIAVVGNGIAWTGGVTLGALASGATAAYFISKLIFLWWDRYKSGKDKSPDED